MSSFIFPEPRGRPEYCSFISSDLFTFCFPAFLDDPIAEQRADSPHMTQVVKHRVTGRQFIRKQFEKTFSLPTEPVHETNWRNELRTLLMIDCPFFVKLVDFFGDDRVVTVILELCPDGTLQNEIERKIQAGASFSEAVCHFSSHFSSLTI